MMRIVALWSQKGGCGKTTSTINLAAELAEHNDVRVLLVDLDDQASLSETFRFFPDNIRVSFADLLDEKPTGKSVLSAIHDTDVPSLSIIPATERLYDVAEYINATSIGKEFLLKKMLKSIEDKFDFVLLDCPGERGFLTLNALTAATEVMIPYEPTDHDWKTLNSKNLPYIRKVQETTNPNLKVAGLMVTKYEKGQTLAEAYLQIAKEKFSGRIFESPIPYATAAKKAIAMGQPIAIYQRSHAVRDAYKSVANELIHENA